MTVGLGKAQRGQGRHRVVTSDINGWAFSHLPSGKNVEISFRQELPDSRHTVGLGSCCLTVR